MIVQAHDRVSHASAPLVLERGGTFRMGSDRHYPEEAPTLRVTVGSFWIDRTPSKDHQS
jgi:formylglycine-generating enzyme